MKCKVSTAVLRQGTVLPNMGGLPGKDAAGKEHSRLAHRPQALSASHMHCSESKVTGTVRNPTPFTPKRGSQHKGLMAG